MIKGRKQSVSRIAVITGLNRKAVKAVRDRLSSENSEFSERYNRAARVIAGWRRDPLFQKSSGEPGELPLDDSPSSFNALVKKYSGDVPPRAVLDELKRVGAVEQIDNGCIRLLTRSFLPSNDDQMKLYILGVDSGDWIATISHNLESAPRRPFFQRKVSYDNLPAETLEAITHTAEEKSQALLEELDGFISRHDRDTNPDISGKGRYRAGVGIYYFEEDLDDTA